MVTGWITIQDFSAWGLIPVRLLKREARAEKGWQKDHGNKKEDQINQDDTVMPKGFDHDKKEKETSTDYYQNLVPTKGGNWHFRPKGGNFIS